MGLQFLELILNFIIFLRKAILRDYINWVDKKIIYRNKILWMKEKSAEIQTGMFIWFNWKKYYLWRRKKITWQYNWSL